VTEKYLDTISKDPSIENRRESLMKTHTSIMNWLYNQTNSIKQESINNYLIKE
jgi:hypothetical protein